MPFRLDKTVYDPATLNRLGSGSFGDVWDLGNKTAAKIYSAKPDDQRVRKLVQLFDIGSSIQSDGTSSDLVALPQRPAFDTSDNAVAGFSMTCYRDWIGLSRLTFNAKTGQYWKDGNFAFTDESAVHAIFTLFGGLTMLERRHIAIGDISPKNILVDPRNGTPAFIDMDDATFEDWESDSLGTDGYVDPNVLLDGDLNAADGYHFDSRTDVFALTAVAFVLVTGLKPFHVPLLPPLSPEDCARKGLSSLRVMLEGDACLRPHNLQIAQPAYFEFLRERLASVRKVTGSSGQDGE